MTISVSYSDVLDNHMITDNHIVLDYTIYFDLVLDNHIALQPHGISFIFVRMCVS